MTTFIILHFCFKDLLYFDNGFWKVKPKIHILNEINKNILEFLF